MFSDPDEIPNPDVLKGIDLKNKFGVFNQLFFNYKFNLFNPHETPWDGTRICKKKNLKSIDDLRNKIKTKNLGYSFLRFDKEKNIQVFANAGWHFNNIMSPENISLKLKTFAHKEYSSDKFSSVENIKEKINKRIDLFGRGYSYEAIEIDNRFPKYLRENLNKFKKFIID
jgi:beta-1,4-mannosyl-glycoprotein beta-1,4-N-acetylglucosaminyltransferase